MGENATRQVVSGLAKFYNADDLLVWPSENPFYILYVSSFV